MNGKSVAAFILLAGLNLSFKPPYSIDRSFTNAKKIAGLKLFQTDRLEATKDRVLKTEEGNAAVSLAGGYRIWYNNEHSAPAVTIRVELSEEGAYAADTTAELQHLSYKLAHNAYKTETDELIRLRYNGYLISGMSRADIESGNNLGTFVMFPGNGVRVTFYFNNLKPGVRHFESLDDYKAQRNAFLGEYTSRLAARRS